MTMIFSPKFYAKFCVIVVLKYVYRALENGKLKKRTKPTVYSFGFGQFQKVSANDIKFCRRL